VYEKGDWVGRKAILDVMMRQFQNLLAVVRDWHFLCSHLLSLETYHIPQWCAWRTRILIMFIFFLQHKISPPVACIYITGMEPVEFHSVTRVGSGYSMYELSELLQKLSPHWQRVLPGHCAPGLVWTKEKPDVWVAPQNSYILEVNSSLASCVTQCLFYVKYRNNLSEVSKMIS
jgi:hypothetical protein